ncbi:MAG: hypothetical protein KGL39_09885 [Patescibacteria group bacterium]|nr:hypothetical protein [Patescibacteria group bacterium]
MEVGDLVQLRKGVFVGSVPKDIQDNLLATVERLLGNGGVYLNQHLRGSRYWHEVDLEFAKKGGEGNEP